MMLAYIVHMGRAGRPTATISAAHTQFQRIVRPFRNDMFDNDNVSEHFPALFVYTNLNSFSKPDLYLLSVLLRDDRLLRSMLLLLERLYSSMSPYTSCRIFSTDGTRDPGMSLSLLC